MKNILLTIQLFLSISLFSQTSEIIWMETEYNDKKILVNSNTKVPIDGIVFFNPISMNCPDGKNIGYGPIEGEFYGYRVNFKNGFKNGLSKFCFLSGQIKMTGNFVDGKRDGVWNYYYRDSTAVKVDGWENNFYYRECKSMEITYSKGIVTNERFFNKDGSISDNDIVDPFSPTDPSQNLFVIYLDIGIRKGFEKDYEGSIEEFNKAIELNLGYSRAYQCRASSKQSLKDYNGAIIDYSRGMELSTDKFEKGMFCYDRAITKKLAGLPFCDDLKTSCGLGFKQACTNYEAFCK